MGIFSNIVGSIFNHKLTAQPTDYKRPYIPSGVSEPEAPEPDPSASMASVTTGATPAPTVNAPAAPAAAAAGQTSVPDPVADVSTTQGEPVDVEAVLTDMAKSNPEKLDWKRSIVDLLKLLNLDSSLSARKELADELGYTGDKGDSAAMNVWLHKQVLRKLSEHGGKVPQDLLV